MATKKYKLPWANGEYPLNETTVENIILKINGVLAEMKPEMRPKAAMRFAWFFTGYIAGQDKKLNIKKLWDGIGCQIEAGVTSDDPNHGTN